MIELREVSFEDFIELVDYLDSISEGGTQALLGRFFPDISSTQELELSYVVETRNREFFESFKSKNPDIKMDPEGRSEPSRKNYWEIELKSLDSVHAMASDYLSRHSGIEDVQNKPNTQVANAKSLSCLASMPKMDPSFYVIKRKMFLDKNVIPSINGGRIERAEASLRSLGIAPNTFLTYFFAYCSPKKPDNYRIFADHVLRRLVLLSQPGAMESQSNVDFLAAVKSVSEKNK